MRGSRCKSSSFMFLRAWQKLPPLKSGTARSFQRVRIPHFHRGFGTRSVRSGREGGVRLGIAILNGASKSAVQGSAVGEW
jgi:hypothetical protein